MISTGDSTEPKMTFVVGASHRPDVGCVSVPLYRFRDGQLTRRGLFSRMDTAELIKKENGSLKPVKERKKHDRFNGMPEEEVVKRTLPDHLTTNLDIVIVSPFCRLHRGEM